MRDRLGVPDGVGSMCFAAGAGAPFFRFDSTISGMPSAALESSGGSRGGPAGEGDSNSDHVDSGMWETSERKANWLSKRKPRQMRGTCVFLDDDLAFTLTRPWWTDRR